MNQVEIKRKQIEICSGIIGLINILIFGSKLGNEGVTYLIVALECFAFIWTISASCLTDTLGRMLRMRITKGQYKNILNIRRMVLILQGIIGIVCSILLLACAGVLAQNVFKVPHSTFIIMLLAPALFMRTISAILIGYFQGEGSELPAAVAAPLRQVVLLGFGLLFINLLGGYGTKVSNLLGDTSYTAMYEGVGIAIAFDLAEFLVLVFLGVIAVGNKKSWLKRDNEGMKQTDSFIGMVKILYGSMWMPILLRVFELFPLWIGTIFYRKSVTDADIFAENFGMFVGKFFVICAIPVLLICAMLVSVNVKTVSAFRKDDHRSAKMIFQSGLHIVVIHGLFFSVFIAIMAEQIAGMVSKTNSVLVADLFRSGSTLILFVSLFYYFSRLLMRMRGKYHVLGCLGVVNILFIIIVSVLLNGGKAGILSLIYAAIAAAGVGCVALAFMCLGMLRSGIEWLPVIAVPVGSVCVSGLICIFLGNLLTPHLGNTVTVIVCLVLSFIVYWVLLLLFRSFKEQELKYIPGGEIIRAAGQTLKVFYMD